MRWTIDASRVGGRTLEAELDRVRLFGDLVLAAYFSGEKPKERETKRTEFADAVQGEHADQYRRWLDEWRHAEQPLAPFHWELEFPEVFERRNPGFDVFVGNPPFAGKIHLVAGTSGGYSGWLQDAACRESRKGRPRRTLLPSGFDLLRDGGALGLIATNTIARGHARDRLRLDLHTWGDYLRAFGRRVKWPGQAAVVVSVVHVAKGAVLLRPMFLDGRRGRDDYGVPLPSRRPRIPRGWWQTRDKSFQGSSVLGIGFPSTTRTTRRRDTAREWTACSSRTRATRRSSSLYRWGGSTTVRPRCIVAT